MGSGGIIFVAILALWAVYLVPVLVSERSSRLDNRAADRTSPAVRVLQRPPAERPSRRVVLTVDRPLVRDDLPARPTQEIRAVLDRDARRTRWGVRVRAAAALVGVVALLVTVVAAAASALPWWSAALAATWLAAVLTAGAVTAAVRRRAVAPPPRVAALPPRAHRVATEVFDDRASRDVPRSARPPAAAGADPTAGAGEAAGSTVAGPAELEAAAQAAAASTDDSWTPVEVPGPVYATKPVSHRPPALPWSMPTAPAAVDASAAAPEAHGATAASVLAAAADEAAARATAYEDDEPVERRSAAG